MPHINPSGKVSYKKSSWLRFILIPDVTSQMVIITNAMKGVIADNFLVDIALGRNGTVLIKSNTKDFGSHSLRT